MLAVSKRVARATDRRIGRRSFTLVELLVVLGIFALMMTMAAPVFLKRSPTTAAQGAVLQLKSTLSLARQWAVTRRHTTYVVFPEDSSVFTGAPHLAVTAMRGYNIMTKEDGWLGEWQFLPIGFVFSRNSKHGGTTNLFHAVKTDRVFSLPFPYTNSPPRDMRCVSFKPNGRLNQTGGTTLEVVFTAGTIDANTNGTVSAYMPAANAPAFGVRIHPLTGRLTAVEYKP